MSICKKERQKEHARKHYEANKEKCKARAKKYTMITYTRNRNFANRYKLFVGCRECGYRKCAASLEFHHTGEKDGNVSRLIAQGCGTKRVKKEIRKCIVLCANCHRELHDAV